VTRVLVTRPQPGADRTAARLHAAGFEAVVLPLSQIVPLEPVRLGGAFDAIAVSSANAVRNAPAWLVARLQGLPMFAVGAETAAAAREAGFSDIRSSAGAVADLARDVVAGVRPKARLAYLCGRVRLEALETELFQTEIEVTAIETYDTRHRAPSRQELAALDNGPIGAVLVYSAKAAEALAAIVAPRSGTIFRGAAFIAISGRVAERLATVAPGKVIAAGSPDEDAMFDRLRGAGYEPAPFPINLA